MVEHRLAKAGVAGSSPVFRSIYWRRSQVAKAEVCKTSIPRFKSGRRLQQILVWAISSGGEHLLDAERVVGSNPTSPTIIYLREYDLKTPRLQDEGVESHFLSLKHLIISPICDIIYT
jgi:hypothetical protein